MAATPRYSAKKQISFFLTLCILPLLVLAIAAAGFYGGNFYREYLATKKLKAMLGFLPGDTSLNRSLFNRQLDFYSVSKNTPDFYFNAYDENFKPARMKTDSNGFVTGGADLKYEKEQGITRILITGGSAAFGSMQNSADAGDSTAPSGTYSYEASIAGYLKKALETKHPGRKFEVINAAVVEHMFHQNVALYFQRLHNFEADIIISMDGWNDVGVFMPSRAQGHPYLLTDGQHEEILTLELLSRYRGSYSSLLKNITAYRQDKNPADGNRNISDISLDLSAEAYKAMEPLFIKNAQKLLWLYQSWVRQLRQDGVYSIVALQPMLCRREGNNKQLSPSELKIRMHIETKVLREIVASFDELAPPEDSIYFKDTGDEKYKVATYVEAFFYDRYYSSALDSVVGQAGGEYLLI